MQFKKKSSWLFLIISLIHLFGQLISSSSITNYTKPLLIPLLILSYAVLVHSKREKVTSGHRIFVFLALVCSFLGDVLLMQANKNEIFFLLGLGAFLLAHTFYIYSFFSIAKEHHESIKPNRWIIIIALIYLVIMIVMLYAKLDAVMRIAVIIYGSVISLMVIVASGLKSVLEKNSYGKLVVGATLFVLSDSMIAFNRFLIEIPMSGFWIMFTYIVAQFLIIKSLILSNNYIRL